MTLSFPTAANLKQYLPGLYFISVATYVGVQNQNLWMILIAVSFIAQMILNNRYINLGMGTLTIVWSAFMVFGMVAEFEPTFRFFLVALSFTVLNLYMSRMLFLNQNFAIAPLRENSLDEILFL
jgi:hypothetical protein